MRLPSPRPCIPSPPVAGRQKQALGLLVGCSSSCHLPWGWWSECSKRNVFLGEEFGSTSPVISHSSLHYSFPFTNTLPSTCISIQLLVPSPVAFCSFPLCSFPARFCSNHTPSFNTTSHPYHSSPLLFPHCFPLFFLLFFPLFIPLFQVVPPIAPPSPSLAAVCLHCSLSLANTLTLFPHPSSFLSFVFAFLFLIFTTCHHPPRSFSTSSSVCLASFSFHKSCTVWCSPASCRATFRCFHHTGKVQPSCRSFHPCP